MTELLPCVEVGPSEDAQASIVWLHGLGADGHDFEPIVPELGLDSVRYIFPHAPSRPVTVNGGMVMPAWFDIAEIDLRRTPDEQGLIEAAAQVQALVQREEDRGVPSDRILLAGFSQGGAVALHLGLRYPRKLAGILALSTYLPTLALADPSEYEAQHTEVNAQIPILQCHGTMDPVVDIQRGVETRERLTELGYPLEFKEYPMMHELCFEELQDVRSWLRERVG